MEDVMVTVKKVASRKNMVGVALIGVGVVVGFGANLSMLNRVWFTLPGFGDVTLIRVMGVITLGLGVAVLTKFDPLELQEAV